MPSYGTDFYFLDYTEYRKYCIGLKNQSRDFDENTLFEAC